MPFTQSNFSAWDTVSLKPIEWLLKLWVVTQLEGHGWTHLSLPHLTPNPCQINATGTHLQVASHLHKSLLCCTGPGMPSTGWTSQHFQKCSISQMHLWLCPYTFLRPVEVSGLEGVLGLVHWGNSFWWWVLRTTPNPSCAPHMLLYLGNNLSPPSNPQNLPLMQPDSDIRMDGLAANWLAF